MNTEHWSAVYGSARAVRVSALDPFGFTERQTRFLVTVMAHSGSFLERQYCAFAGIVRGQNRREFVARLVARGYATAITHGNLRRGRIYHVHHKPLYEAIGLPDDRHRKPQTVGRMVQRLMILDAVLADKNCWWMGPACDKRSYFATTMKTGLSAAQYPQIAFGSGTRKTIRYFPDKLPIGVDKRNLDHHVFLYLVTRPIPLDFRMFLLRHAELLRMLHPWTVRVLVPRRFWKAAALYKAALCDELWTPLEPHITDRLEAYFRERRQDGGHLSDPSDEYLLKAFRRYGRPRFASLYRAWRCMGDRILWAARSPVLRDARERGWGTCEMQPLTGQYLQLTGLIDGHDRARRGAKRKIRAVGPSPASPAADDVITPLVTL
jgi:hypothetical protein